MYEKMLCLSFTFWTQWNTRMQSKQVALYAVLLLAVVSAIKENDKIKSTSSRNDLKHKFGCRPNGKWNVLSLKYNAVEVICMSRDYEVENEPKEITLNPILINIENSTLVGIDEKEKTMTMDIQLAAIWADERIKVVVPLCGRAVRDGACAHAVHRHVVVEGADEGQSRVRLAELPVQEAHEGGQKG